MKIVITDKIALPERYISELKKLGDITIYNDIPAEESVIIERVSDAEVITAD